MCVLTVYHTDFFFFIFLHFFTKTEDFTRV
ncbi:hypothetical protein VSDKYIMU_CDS0145 [Enterococcus phage VRE9_4]